MHDFYLFILLWLMARMFRSFTSPPPPRLVSLSIHFSRLAIFGCLLLGRCLFILTAKKCWKLWIYEVGCFFVGTLMTHYATWNSAAAAVTIVWIKCFSEMEYHEFVVGMFFVRRSDGDAAGTFSSCGFNACLMWHKENNRWERKKILRRMWVALVLTFWALRKYS